MRGGKRPNSGRKVGKRDITKRVRKTNVPIKTGKKIQKFEKADKPLYLAISKYLTKKNRTLYKKLTVKYDTPLASLKALRDDLQVRYNFARIAEIEGAAEARRIAKEHLDELVIKGTYNDKEIKDEKAKKDLEKNLRKEANRKTPRISGMVTQLTSELRQLNELIDRIEFNRPDLAVNILNLVNNQDKKQVRKFEDRLFTLPEDITDAEVIKDNKRKNEKI